MNITGDTFADSIIGLTYNTTYYIRSYARTATDTVYSPQDSVTTIGALVPLTQSYNGGYVFYIDSTGEHGLIVAANDIGRFKWMNCGGSVVTSFSIGSGKANTETIVKAIKNDNSVCSCCVTIETVAAQACYDLVLNGYDDWFLPSWNELQEFNLAWTIVT